MASGSPASLTSVVRSLWAPDEVASAVRESAHREEASSVLGPGPVRWAVQVVRETITDVGPVTGDPGDLQPGLTLAGEVLLLGILLELVGGAPGETYFASVHAQRARSVTREGVPTEAGIRIARRAQEGWTQRLLDQAQAEGAPVAVLRDIAVVVGACFDRFIDRLTAARQVERARIDDQRVERRRLLVEALVDGRPVDPQEVRAELQVDLCHHHLALVVTPRGEQPPGEHEMQRAIDRALRGLSPSAVVRHVPPDRAELWIWVNSAESVAPDAVDLTAFAHAEVYLGVGTAQPGAVGFRRSHLEALDAERVARGPRGPLTRHDDVTLTALLSLDLERARWFVRDQLGALADHDPAMAELRATLRSLYHSGMRLATTAARLHLHRNTLVNRLHRIEKLMGHGVGDQVAETQGAIQLIEDLGEQVLGHPASD